MFTLLHTSLVSQVALVAEWLNANINVNHHWCLHLFTKRETHISQMKGAIIYNGQCQSLLQTFLLE